VLGDELTLVLVAALFTVPVCVPLLVKLPSPE
jgi:hypothetical protein